MALVACPDCGNQNSAMARVCPMCGRPLKSQDPFMESVADALNDGMPKAASPKVNLYEKRFRDLMRTLTTASEEERMALGLELKSLRDEMCIEDREELDRRDKERLSLVKRHESEVDEKLATARQRLSQISEVNSANWLIFIFGLLFFLFVMYLIATRPH